MTTEGKKSKYLLHLLVMVVITFGFRFLPCPGNVTSYGMAVLGVFLGLVYGWTFLGLLMPSLFGAVAMATTGYGSAQDIFVAMFSNSTVLMMLLGVLAFTAVQQSGAGDWMVAKLLGSKLAQKSPVMILEVFFLIFIIGNIVGIVWFLYFALMPLMSNMLIKCGYEKGDKFNFFFLAGCLMAGQMGMSIFPFMGWSLMTVGTMMSLTKVMVPYNGYMALMVVAILLVMATYPFLMKLCGCSFSKLATVDIETAFPNAKADEKMTLRQSLALWSVVVFVAILVIVSMIGSRIGFLNWINTNIGVLGLMVVLWIFVLAFKVEGKPILDMNAAAGAFSWDMLMLIAIALFISSALTAPETGISSWIAGLLMPIFSQASPIVFLIALAAPTIVLTNVSNNIALCFVMINIVCSMYLNGFPVNITAAAVVISLTSVFVAYLTPAASLPGALLHASGCLKASTIYKWTWPLMLYGLIVLMLVIIPYTFLAA